jgi:hypothetical protein
MGACSVYTRSRVWDCEREVGEFAVSDFFSLFLQRLLFWTSSGLNISLRIFELSGEVGRHLDNAVTRQDQRLLGQKLHLALSAILYSL